MSKGRWDRNVPVYPLEKKPDPITDGYQATHPAFGIIQINRVSGRFENLVGVDYPQGHAVCLRLMGAKLDRRYGETHWMEEKLVTEVFMSEVQFAQAISSLNSAERVPVTFRYYPNGEGLFDPGEPPVHMHDTEDRIEEVIETYDDGVKALEAAIAIAKEKKVPKVVLIEMEKAYREIVQNKPFMEEQARKGIRKAAQKAKMEVTAFAQQVVRQFGLQKLGADKALLLEEAGEFPETPQIGFRDLAEEQP